MIRLAFLCCMVLALTAGMAFSAEPGKTINIVVVTGGHAYNEKTFPD